MNEFKVYKTIHSLNKAKKIMIFNSLKDKYYLKSNYIICLSHYLLNFTINLLYTNFF